MGTRHHIIAQKIHIFLGHFRTALVLTWMYSSLTSGCVHGDVHQYSKDEIPVSADFYTEKTQDLDIILFCLI